jgi:undecaprenyl-diphosphatase
VLLAVVLLGLFAVFTVVTIGPLGRVDVALNGPRYLAPWRDELMAIDRIGQRAVCLPLLAILTAVVAYRVRDWRPVTVAALAVVGLNLLVLILKLSLGREGPRLEDPAFFNGGDMYPSGHTANVVLVYGLMGFLLLRYGVASRRLRGWLVAAVVALSIVMTATSLALRWHWFTDLVSGLFVGAAVLALTAAFDTAIPWQPNRQPAPSAVGAKSPVPSEPR